VILSRTANAATADVKAELLLHLNFKAIFRGSILTSVPIGYVVRSRHSSPSVAARCMDRCGSGRPLVMSKRLTGLLPRILPNRLIQNTGSDPKVYLSLLVAVSEELDEAENLTARPLSVSTSLESIYYNSLDRNSS
jgi:hypothetical protein